MKKGFLFCLLLALLGIIDANAQAVASSANRFFYRGLNTVIIANAAGTVEIPYQAAHVSVKPYSTFILVEIAGSSGVLYTPAQFLNQAGTAYSLVSAAAAVTGWSGSVPISSGGGGGVSSYYDLTDRPQSLADFSNTPGYQTAAQVATAISNAGGSGGGSTYTLQYRQTGLATTSGTNVVLTHSLGANTGIDRIIGYETGTRVSVDIPFDVASVTDSQVTITPAATTTYTILIIGHKLQ